jgi:hypothetical protein
MERNSVIFNNCLQSLIAAVVAGNLMLHAASSVVGVAAKNGDFKINHSRVQGNATLFEGNLIETGSGLTRLRLNNGAQLRLASQSAGRVFQDRIVLERGAGELTGDTYGIEALSIRIQPDSSASRARVSLRDGKVVQVLAINGDLRVVNSRGSLVARLDSGRALEFTPQDGASVATRVTGMLKRNGDRFVIQDETTNVVSEVRGKDLNVLVGRRISVTGSVLNERPSDGISQVVEIKTVNGSVAAAAPGPGSIGVKHSTSFIGARTAIILGVGVSAAAAGAVVALAQGDDNPTSVSPSTR